MRNGYFKRGIIDYDFGCFLFLFYVRLLHDAVNLNLENVVEELLHAGASPLVENEMGETPFDLSANSSIQRIFLGF